MLPPRVPAGLPLMPDPETATDEEIGGAILARDTTGQINQTAKILATQRVLVAKGVCTAEELADETLVASALVVGAMIEAYQKHPDDQAAAGEVLTELMDDYVGCGVDEPSRSDIVVRMKQVEAARKGA